MEEPFYYATLFPEEKVAFKRLWELLETPNMMSRLIDIAPLTAPKVINTSTLPGPMVLPNHLAIASLPFSDTLKRLQLVHNDDQDYDTVSMSDLKAAAADPGRWTNEDIEDFEYIKIEFRKIGKSYANPELTVELPGKENLDLSVTTGINFFITTNTSYIEKRLRKDKPFHSRFFSIKLSAQRSRKVVSKYLQGLAKTLIIDESTGEILQIIANNQDIILDSGCYIIQLWKNQKRIVNERISLVHSIYSGEVQEKTINFHDHKIILSNGQKLFKNVISNDSYYNYGEIHAATFSYELIDDPNDEIRHKTLLSLLATPTFNLLKGKYPFQFGSDIAVIEVYNKKVIMVNYNNGSSYQLKAGYKIDDEVFEFKTDSIEAPQTQFLPLDRTTMDYVRFNVVKIYSSSNPYAHLGEELKPELRESL